MISRLPTYPVETGHAAPYTASYRRRELKHASQQARLVRMYHGTPFYLRMCLAYFPEDCVDQLVARTLTRCPCYALAPLYADPCSRTYYERQRLTYDERLRREVDGRRERGEFLDRLGRRQAC